MQCNSNVECNANDVVFNSKVGRLLLRGHHIFRWLRNGQQVGTKPLDDRFFAIECIARTPAIYRVTIHCLREREQQSDVSLITKQDAIASATYIVAADHEMRFIAALCRLQSTASRRGHRFVQHRLLLLVLAL